MATVLKRGSKGAAVRELQRMLNSAGASPVLDDDGDFGRATEGALVTFQKKYGLVTDGRYGTQSRTALKQALTPAKAPTRPEPDKSAMAQQCPVSEPGTAIALPPPNVSSLKLLETAREIVEIDIHCAATPEGKDFTVEDIRRWHKERGFSDIGYHYVIYRDGRILVARPIGQIGAHISGRNTGTIGICYIGGVSADGKAAKDTRTARQTSSLLWLTQELATLHGVRRIAGHNEFAAKACPSFSVPADPLGKIAA